MKKLALVTFLVLIFAIYTNANAALIYTNFNGAGSASSAASVGKEYYSHQDENGVSYSGTAVSLWGNSSGLYAKSTSIGNDYYSASSIVEATFGYSASAYSSSLTVYFKYSLESYIGTASYRLTVNGTDDPLLDTIIGVYSHTDNPIIDTKSGTFSHTFDIRPGVPADIFLSITTASGLGYGYATASITDLSITPSSSAVPIPPSVWLLGSGLIGLIGLRRRFRKIGSGK